MAVTYETIQTYTANGGVGAIDFTSIPQTYSALALHISARSSRASYADDVKIVINNNSGISCKNIRAYAHATSSLDQDGGTGTTFNYIGIVNGLTDQQYMFGVCEYYFPNYTNTSMNKVIVAQGGSTVSNGDARQMGLASGVFNTNSAISRITLSGYNDTSNTWIQDSTFYLYGIKYS